MIQPDREFVVRAGDCTLDNKTVSALYEGMVMHRRLVPARHQFRYRVFSLLIDLDELPALGNSWLFGHNRPALFSFHDSDHGDNDDIRSWAKRLLHAHGISAEGALRVLCYPRILGFVFNPLSVWFCHHTNGALAAIIYEVHNTYGERHSYVLPATRDDGFVQHYANKAFYVSPFLSMNCRYDFRVRPPGQSVTVSITEREYDKPVLIALFEGSRKPLNSLALLSAFVRYPLMTLKVVAAIHLEAVRLMLKRVPRHAHDGTRTPAPP